MLGHVLEIEDVGTFTSFYITWGTSNYFAVLHAQPILLGVKDCGLFFLV